MKKPTLDQIELTMQGLNMKVFTDPFDMNLGAIRTKDNMSNTFNDWLFMYYRDQDGNLTGLIESGTTDAGLYYRLNPINWKGTAIIQHGKQYRGSFTYMLKGGHNGQEAFRQTGPIDYWRDPNRDKYLDFVNPEIGKIYNTNGHDMGDRGTVVHNWSAGCWGAVRKTMDKFYALANLQIKNGLGPKFTFTLLHENNF